MRTTVSIDDAIYEEARRIAFESRRTLGEVVNELLAAGLESRAADRRPRELGRLRGTIVIADDFDETPEEIRVAIETEV